MAAREWQRRPEVTGGDVFAASPRVLAAVALLALGLGAAGGWLAGRALGAPAPAEAVAEAGTETVPDERLLRLDPFLVNLAGEGEPRYLRVRIALDVEDAASRRLLADHEAQVRDAVIALLSTRDWEDVTRFEGRALLKHDLRERLDGVVSGAGVRDVLFTEFVAQ